MKIQRIVKLNPNPSTGIHELIKVFSILFKIGFISTVKDVYIHSNIDVFFSLRSPMTYMQLSHLECIELSKII